MKNFKACIVPTACLTSLLLYCLLLGHIKDRCILQEEITEQKDSVNTIYVGSSYKVTLEKLQ